MIGNNYQMGNLSLADVQAVLEVDRLKSFRRAADACKISQPSLSAQVKKVEEALGARLFERERRQFSVTEAGIRAIPYLRSIADAYRELGESVSKSEDAPLCGSLSLGMIPTLGPYYAPHL